MNRTWIVLTALLLASLAPAPAADNPGESRNLAAERPADVARLESAFENWQADVKRDASEPAARPVQPKK